MLSSLFRCAARRSNAGGIASRLGMRVNRNSTTGTIAAWAEAARVIKMRSLILAFRTTLPRPASHVTGSAYGFRLIRVPRAPRSHGISNSVPLYAPKRTFKKLTECTQSASERKISTTRALEAARI